jgi:hypothetical protein
MTSELRMWLSMVLFAIYSIAALQNTLTIACAVIWFVSTVFHGILTIKDKV